MKELYKGIKDMSKFDESLNAQSPVEVVKETEKAVAIDDTYDFDSYQKLLWVPKSIIDNNVIPFWFLSKNRRSYYDR